MINIHFEIAALGLSIIPVFSYSFQKKLPVIRNEIFLCLLWITMTAMGFNILGTLMYDGVVHASKMVQVSINLLYDIFNLSMISIYMLYIGSLTSFFKLETKRIVVMLFPSLLYILYLVFSIWEIFAYSENFIDRERHAKICMYSLGMGMFYLVYSSYVIFHYKKELQKNRVIQLLSFNSILIIGSMAQHYIGKNILFMYFIVTIIFFTIFLIIQNPELYLDEITKSFNWAGFCEVIKEKIRFGRKFSFLLIRINHYGAMSQIYDDIRLQEVRKEIAGFLNVLIPGQRVYHVSKSSFIIMAEDEKEVKEIYQKLHRQLTGNWLVDQEKVVHEYSFYYGNYPEEDVTYNEIIQRLLYAKSDHVGHHKPGTLIPLTHKTVEEAEEFQKVAQIVENAVMDNTIEIWFQPIYSMQKGYITSVEVLARLKDENKKYINPEYFIHIAEKTHNIIQLGEQIYRKACIFASQNHLFDLGIEDMNINLSPIQCGYEGLADDLVRIANEYHIPMKRMHLEITESALMDKKEIFNTLTKLRETGAQVALDDFGTGYSNLTSIMNLPINYVKIDKSLVWSYADGKNQFLNELVPMIQEEGMKIIAEGIENEEHIRIFKELNGEYLQGYYYSKPIPGMDFLHFLKKENKDFIAK